MDNDENKTETTPVEPVSTEPTTTEPVTQEPATTEPAADSQSMFQKNPALKTVAGIAGVAVFLLAAIALRNNYLENRLQGTGADASCYGYNCQPSVIIGGRIHNPSYNNNSFSYGTLSIKRGDSIELTWYGTNVERCTADWTKFQGTYYQPTVYAGRISGTQRFNVTCYKGRTKVTSSINVKVLSR